MKLSDYVMQYLYAKGVRTIFGYTGGSITHLIDSLHSVNGLVYVQNYHEQASAFCADALARVTNGLGVAMATSGPGATNLITGIANSYFDSIPCLYITGQVSTRAIKSGPEIRQQGFQETDIVSIVRPITKFAETLKDPLKIRFVLDKAIFLAISGRPGAVLVDIPHNLQTVDITPSELEGYIQSEGCDGFAGAVNQDVFDSVLTMIRQAVRPVILVGGGMAKSYLRPMLENLAEVCDTPVVASLMGLDSIDHNNPYFCGFIGSYGNRYANLAVAYSDLLIVLGSRLDERQTGDDRASFAKHAKIIHVDIDPTELNHNIKSDLPIQCDLAYFLHAVTTNTYFTQLDHSAWRRLIHEWAQEYAQPPNNIANGCVDPNEFLTKLSHHISKNSIVTLDVGQNQMWAAQSLHINTNMRTISSSGHGAMGYALPAGIGAYFAEKGRQIVCIMGDGGIQMNIQELQTVVRENIPLKIFVLNNNSLGMIRDFHEKYFSDKCYGSVSGYANPSFERLAYAYDIPYTLIEDINSIVDLPGMLASSRPHLFEVKVAQKSSVYPCPAPRSAVHDQLPRLSIDELTRIEKVALGQ